MDSIGKFYNAIYTASRAVTNPSQVFHTLSGDSKVSRRIRDP